MPTQFSDTGDYLFWPTEHLDFLISAVICTISCHVTLMIFNIFLTLHGNKQLGFPQRENTIHQLSQFTRCVWRRLIAMHVPFQASSHPPAFFLPPTSPWSSYNSNILLPLKNALFETRLTVCINVSCTFDCTLKHDTVAFPKINY